MFLDFARYWGFTPRLCRPYRAMPKGKIESGVKYIRRNFLGGLQGREPSGLDDLNARLRRWTWAVANQRVHGTMHEPVMNRGEGDLAALQPLDSCPMYPFQDDQMRKGARDALVNWQGRRLGAVALCR